jgi:hypothetical protein
LLPLACRNGFWPFEGFTPYIASCTVCRQKSDKPKRRGFSKRRGFVKKGRLRKQLQLKKLEGLKRCKLDLTMLQCKLLPSSKTLTFFDIILSPNIHMSQQLQN